MATTGDTNQTLDCVKAPLRYFVYEGEKPFSNAYMPESDPRRSNARYEDQETEIRDGSPDRDSFTLDDQGFAVVPHETGVMDFYDVAQIRAVYDDEVKQLLKDATGCSKVVIFDHTLRAESDATREGTGVSAPVRIVHNDYTAKSGPQRVRDLLPADQAEELLKRRFAIVNVWRSTRGPVRSAPLALCDAQSIAPGDLVSSDLNFRHRSGETQRMTYNPEHRWFYFRDLEYDQALLIKCYDSETDGRARFAAHTAFDVPTMPADAPPRESIETRTFLFF